MGRRQFAQSLPSDPDLVFLDVQMPGLDGFDVLRATASIHQPFVVFVTAHDEHAIRAFEVQAVDYLLKPVIEARFREAVRRVVARLRGESTADIADKWRSSSSASRLRRRAAGGSP
jgi:two-component system LytT family response regulator